MEQVWKCIKKIFFTFFSIFQKSNQSWNCVWIEISTHGSVIRIFFFFGNKKGSDKEIKHRHTQPQLFFRNFIIKILKFYFLWCDVSSQLMRHYQALKITMPCYAYCGC